MEWHLLATALLPQWAMLALIQRLSLNTVNELLFYGSIALISIPTTIVLIYHQQYNLARKTNHCLSDNEVCSCCDQQLPYS
ncbi:hypothetical protein OIT44_05150 [Weissella ceti]|uniref:Uncharacterized protein n=1 Tax=Weissella ceti TaxID=759620 RepID=A0ABT3E4X2_9LACO|nr:hypothetical protein [Weissella ceti]MCW0953456.1 hypothetical protein [Weissella ceti]